METNVTASDSRLNSLIVLYDMHTQFYKNVIEGISDEDAQKRLDTKANHIAWIAGSLVQERFELAKLLGTQRTSSSQELFKDHQGIRDNITYPSLNVYRQDWESISPILKKALLEVNPKKLDEQFEMMPGEKYSHYELITFTIHREAYFIGQIGLWRRLLGYEAMKYN